MTFVWNGDRLLAKMRAATILGVDKTLKLCVEESRTGHPRYPPASDLFSPWADRTDTLTFSLKVVADAHPRGPWRITGSWGSEVHYSLFIEIGTSRAGPTATERMLAADGDPSLIVPEIGPLMARRSAMIPTSHRQYPLLAGRIRDAFNA